MPSLPAVTSLTASAPALHQLPRATEVKTLAPSSQSNPKSDFAALIHSFTDAMPSNAEGAAEATPANSPVPLKPNLLTPNAPGQTQAKLVDGEPLTAQRRTRATNEKPEARDLVPEVDLSNIQPSAQIISLNSQEALPLTFNWLSSPVSATQASEMKGALQLTQECTLDPQRATSQQVVTSASGGSTPPLNNPQLPLPFQQQTQGFELAVHPEAVEVPSALTLPDIIRTTVPPRTKIAFEAHLTQDTSKTDRQTSAIPQIPDARSEAGTSGISADRKAGALIPAATRGSTRDGVASAPESPAASDTNRRDTRTGPLSDRNLSASQNAPDAQDRKPSFIETNTQPVNRHAAELNPEPNTAPLAQQHTQRQAENAKPVERPSLSTASQHDIPESAPPRTEPARDISFRIASANAEPVDIKLTERSGQVRVAVHSADPALTRSLQANVTELAGKLERSGFHAETFIPNRAEPGRESHANPNFQDSPKDRRAPHYEPPRPKKFSRSSQTDFQVNMLTNTQQEKS